jgi:biotin carboxyl carrier protein
MKFEIELKGPSGSKKHIVELHREGESFAATIDGQPVAADAIAITNHSISVLLGGESFEIQASALPDGSIQLLSGPHEFIAQVIDPRAWRGRKHGGAEAEGRQQIVAPMPGKVVRLLVAVGDKVEAGQGLLVVEAMKMQNEIRSPKSGKVERLLAKEGQSVNAGEPLAWVE